MSQYLWAAETILNRVRRPMGARELVDRAFAEGLLSDKIHGSTPHKTMHARLSVDIVERGCISRFVRTRRGVYFLRALLGEGMAETEVISALAGAQSSEFRIPIYDAPRVDRRPQAKEFSPYRGTRLQKLLNFRVSN